MASFLSKILSFLSPRSDGADAPAAGAEPVDYNGLAIYAAPIREGAQFRLAGRIEKTSGDQVLVRQFVRADLFTSADEAVSFSVRKAQQIIDQTGPALFADGAASRSV